MAGTLLLLSVSCVWACGARTDLVVEARPVAAMDAGIAVAQDGGLAGVLDAGCRDPPDSAPFFRHAGLCFAQTPSCCSDADCDPSLYRGCMTDPREYAPRPPESALGRCRAWEICSCASDEDCSMDSICIVNQRVCGICVSPTPTPCDSAAACDGERECVDGVCSEHCDG